MAAKERKEEGMYCLGGPENFTVQIKLKWWGKSSDLFLYVIFALFCG